MLRFDRLQTPSDDGATLIEPACSAWGKLIDENRARSPRAEVRLAGQPLEEAREAIRFELLGRSYADGPVIAAGHQPEFIHPGVWAKHIVVRGAAKRFGAANLDLVVDNDAPRTPFLRIPVIGPKDLVATRDVPVLGGPAGAAYESQPPLSDPTIEDIRQNLMTSLGSRLDDSLLDVYLAGLKQSDAARPIGPADFVEQHMAGRRQIDRSLEADLRELRVSQAVGGPFVADLLIDAERFAGAYNESLAEYRREERVASPNRPLPNLERDGDRVETCFWIYRPRRPRTRLWVQRAADTIRLYAGQDQKPVGSLGVDELTLDGRGALASLIPWVVRPRALTLTLWARLLVCDLFVHGIGGAKYDRITDGIFRRYFHLDPPAFTCVSATLRLPLTRHQTTAQDETNARHRLRDLRFNPDRYLASAPTELLAEKRDLIRQSRQLRESDAACSQRREVFRAIREINERLLAQDPHLAVEFAARADSVHQQVKSNQVAENREFFYALQPRRRLESLASRLAEQVDEE